MAFGGLIKSVAITLVVTGSTFISGCAENPEPEPSAVPSDEVLNTREATAKFQEVAHASCTKALAEGVVEQAVGTSGFTLVMVPKNEGYKDFSAAYFEPADKYELIWEADAFSACSVDMQFELAAENGSSVDLQVTYNSTVQAFETTQDLGEFGISRRQYKVAGGVLVSVVDLADMQDGQRTISYGVDEQDRRILETAVDRYLANQ